MLNAFREQYPEVFAAQKHPATSLRTVLKRLVMYGEAIEARPRDGLLTWQATSRTILDENIAEPEPDDEIPEITGNDTDSLKSRDAS
jgi:hypothetical protein